MEIYYGIFYDPITSPITNGKKASKDEKEFDTESKEMLLPFVKITAKFVHEFDYLDLEKPGTYYVLLCNRHSWLHRKNFEILLQLSNADGSEPMRVYLDGTQASMPEKESLIKALNLRNIKD
jgi:hypothetical protein